MTGTAESTTALSPWWRRTVILVLIAGFAVLIGLSVNSYREAPPIPGRVAGADGRLMFTRDDILAGQQVFLKYGLMENGTIWGHGAYLGPDFSAEYLHTLAVDTEEFLARQQYRRGVRELTDEERSALRGRLQEILKENRYDPKTDTLLFTAPEEESYRRQIVKWTDYFADPVVNRGLLYAHIQDPQEIRNLTAFFAWTAWASVANRPGETYSYTNNFPYEPLVGNSLTTGAILWSAISLIFLLAGTAAVLFAFGRFNFLGWKGKDEHAHPGMLPGMTTESQRATIKFFVIAVLLLLTQTLVGGATAHYRADPGSFYGIDFSRFFPSNIFRTWHLQLAIFWIATAYVAGGLFLSVGLGGKEPKGQAGGVHALFAALVFVAVGSLLGEMFGVFQVFGDLWFWFGHQGWEYLDLGRAWQILLVVGFMLWLFLVIRGVGPARKDPREGELSTLFLLTAAAIPFLYLPAMFYGSTTHYTAVDVWRFWIIHLWVEGFFELFVTTMIAVLFYRLGMVSLQTATRVIYLDAILFLGSGIIGTGHHWYWTGQTNVTVALSATFSALEVVPLTLLTLDAWDFIRLSRSQCDVCGRELIIPHRWTFYFMMAVGFWNFVGAGIFGFLINLPVVSYFEVGTILTPNHGHAAMMGVFGMFALSFVVFAIRQVLTDVEWSGIERYIRTSFWGLNIGLALMVVMNLFPAGVLQLLDVLENGYWHARGPEFMNREISLLMEWLRMPADLVFIIGGVVPMAIASLKAYGLVRRKR
ncbi:MAG: nitric-oxide reductase large subunit [Pseudomonadota bacterium]|jgi:nitric oxide reductase subunit B|nr:nitric-oxide reductase large subunit [Syntrophobacterales bacterium]MDI9555736.1 nitric-oxide reductase large subunit [Pseudomonadota bacterium]HNU85494.1 nitric-oxide reductase large subunit [Syntrophales bacterium]HNZ34300.1 nitric-oxide reductase large subunit [Syntrophales bacterium]HOF74223.1 nitric-oxide reductase large subunit [Syntrophales bacterium]